MTKQSVEQKHPRFTNEELELIKTIFADNADIVKLCYKVFFQLDLTKNEEKIREATFKGKCLRGLFDKLFCPGLENEQLFFGVDDWLDVQIDKPLEESIMYIKARALSIEYIGGAVIELFGEDENYTDFAELTMIQEDEEQTMVNILARKEIIAKVRNMFGTIQNWAGTKTETPEEQKKRLFSDSTK